MPYLRTLAFTEKGTPCIVMTVGDHEIENLGRLDSLKEHNRGWLEERDNRLAKPQKSLGSRQDQMENDTWNDGYSQFELTWTSATFGGGGFVTPFEIKAWNRHMEGLMGCLTPLREPWRKQGMGRIKLDGSLGDSA